jgi:hypothetical protein
MRVSRGLQSYTPENIDNRHTSSASPSIGESALRADLKAAPAKILTTG